MPSSVRVCVCCGAPGSVHGGAACVVLACSCRGWVLLALCCPGVLCSWLYLSWIVVRVHAGFGAAGQTDRSGRPASAKVAAKS